MFGYGLCCLFYKEKINFRQYACAKINRIFNESGVGAAKNEVMSVFRNNLGALAMAIDYCLMNNIVGYRMSIELLPKMSFLIANNIIQYPDIVEQVSKFPKIDSRIVLSMHPDQFVHIGAQKQSVVDASVDEVKNHIFLANLFGCKEINIHVGATYGDKKSSTERFIKNMLANFTKDELAMITLENDEIGYSIIDVVNIAEQLGVRVTYDIHHQRCYELTNGSCGISEEECFLLAKKSWNSNYQRLHISSPRDGYTTAIKSRAHADYISSSDFPIWMLKYKSILLDVEAKAKECAIRELDAYIRSITTSSFENSA